MVARNYQQLSFTLWQQYSYYHALFDIWFSYYFAICFMVSLFRYSASCSLVNSQILKQLFFFSIRFFSRSFI